MRCAHRAVTLPAGVPKAHWALDEVSGATFGDYAYPPHAGTISGLAKWTAAGRFGGALDLTSTGRGIVYNAPSNTVARGITTVALWMYWKGDDNGYAMQMPLWFSSGGYGYDVFFHSGCIGINTYHSQLPFP